MTKKSTTASGVNRRGFARVAFELSPDLKAQLMAYAKAKDATTARVLRQLVRRHLEQYTSIVVADRRQP